MVTKNILNNLRSLLNCGLQAYKEEDVKAGKLCGVFPDSENWALMIFSPCACVRYFGLSDAEETSISASVEPFMFNEKAIRGYKSIFDEWEETVNLKSSAYSEKRKEQITAQELKQWMKEEKENPNRKDKSNERILRDKYGVLHNAVLLLRAIRCITKSDDEKVTIYYGHHKLKAIIIKARFGDAAILPCRW